ncbi:phosphoglucosamine mutase [Picrophilus oshimae]|uniref:Phosphomannomutase / phosphoglucomutase n=1 Tax=Picrophilus torridus (strain ATCC 700027 / DSM 9790 / JCM 10055 / NBRC 100828 / KAW 2/3) TaxID=1122961 RepID=A0A8G2L7R4_PICTO|nr:phosphoglucosamine mutase [Picrophilus oshimae]SMD31378.1 phosphomannomutase / phosphoglucomutase [Picrophilus oshimae DSM 9789]
MKYFGTNGIRGIPNEDLTTELSMTVGKAVSTYFNSKTIAVAKDTRISGDMIMNAVISGVMSTGTDVKYLGILPTPGLQYYCKKHNLPGIMITASHNPPEYNGIKCIASDGTEISEESEKEIEDLIDSKKFKKVSWKSSGRLYPESNAIDEYINGIMSLVDVDKIRDRKFKVVIDTGNGAAYFTSPYLLSKYNCHIVSLNANPDGTFSSRNSEPKPENLGDLISLMRSGNFDIGIAHDGDADRCVFIDEHGNFIDGDKSLALIVKYTVKNGDTVVTPVSSSDALSDICAEKNAKLIKTRVGAPIVARTMIENMAVIGGEENGGIIYGKHQYCRDGAMTLSLMLNLLASEKKTLSQLLNDIPDYTIVKSSVERRRGWEEIRKDLIERIDKKIDETDGLKILEDEGWVLIRPSGTEKIIRIYAESKSRDKAAELSNKYKSLLNELI